VDLRTGRPSASAVRTAVQRVLAEPRYRDRARVVGESLARHGGAAAAGELLERLAGSRAPVLRAADPWARLRP
jgi:UDP:flavonoid glycosyltransferase YjiC (YdhE family)